MKRVENDVRSRDAAFWSGLRQRIEGLTQTGTVSPGEAADVLEQRARALAQAPHEANAETTEVVRFTRGAETFLVESRRVLAVAALRRITRLPRVQPPVHGLGVYRGDLLVLAELRPDARRASGAPRVLVLGDDAPIVGLLADAVEGVAQVAIARLFPPARGDGPMIRAVTEEPASLIDVDVLLGHFTRSQP